MNSKILLITITFFFSLAFSGCGLHNAAKTGNIDAAKFWIDTGSDIDSKDTGAQTPLIRAILNDQTEMAKFLVKQGADVNKIGESPNTPIMIATRLKNNGLIEFLIENGAKVQFPKGAYEDRNGSPLHIVAGSDEIEIAQLFLDNGVDVNRTKHSVSPLLISVAANEYAMAKFLLDNGAGVNIVKDDGLSPLHIAVSNGSLEIVKLLVENGANINAKTKRKDQTPLNCARNNEIKKYLISHGGKN